MTGEAVGTCRHCGVQIVRMPDLWLHMGEGDMYWYCRATTVAGPAVSEDDGLPPNCPDHRERQHRDGRAPWCDRCGWRHGKPATQPVKVTDNPRLGDVP